MNNITTWMQDNIRDIKEVIKQEQVDFMASRVYDPTVVEEEIETYLTENE